MTTITRFAKQRAFTLIELLVVIAIIGGLAAMLVPNFMAARISGRDAQRKNDLRQMQKALELYKNDQNPPAYPDSGSLPNPTDCWSSLGGCVGNIYMNKFPGDPIGVPEAFYYYERDASDTLRYTLCSCLENQADSDSADGDCSASYTCASGKKYTLNEP